MAEWEINIMNLDDIKELLIRCVPIIGNILGAGKLYSVWSTKDFEDRCQDIIFHTISGALETLGLGVAALILKIVVTGLFYITELLSWIMYKILSSAMSNQQFAERFSFIFPN
ncbi:hypothetical protein [Chlamydia vaughanii]|uniref:hypothetical protein n=1 Tax=Chlamydia vaughanii TaxID=3112552 RepID=UPI0032B15447